MTRYLHHIPSGGTTVEILLETHFDRVVTSGKPFLRKVRTGESDELLRLLDEHRSTPAM